MAASDAEDAGASPDLDFDESIMADSTSLAVVKTESNASGSSDPKSGSSDLKKKKRKKARRACFACQRAHLTCGMHPFPQTRLVHDINCACCIGDERPCQRCIKRGLQDQCHDGVRKKAKYLSDTPSELLNPPGMGGYHPYINGTKTTTSNSDSSGIPMTGSNDTGHYPPQPQTPTIDVYGQSSSQAQMPPPLSATGSFGNQQSPMSPQFNQHSSQQHMATTMAQGGPGITQYNGLPFDPSDPALFNFDIASLNFGNQYGALEFGMLNHMSSGANSENQDMLNQMNQMQGFNQNYASDPWLTFSQDDFVNANWNNNPPRASSTTGLLSTPNNTPTVSSIDRHDSITQFPKAFAIGAGPPSNLSASPAASSGMPDPPLEQPQSPALFLNTSQAPSAPLITRHTSITSKQHPVQPITTTSDFYNQQPTAPAPHPRKRPYDADIIYETVNKPYSYTSGFHRLFNYITKSFSSEKRIRVAKAVAAIRPSLITFSQGLTEQDLIFMERSVQRKLFEFHDFLQATGTPTIMARRDGAVVSASKEFSILTGWSKSILLGKEANLNVNSGGASGASTAPGSAARTRLSSVERDLNERDPSATIQTSPQTPTPIPVLLAEILDQDTVVQFYEDYARLAFSSAGGSVLRRGRLLKYRTKSEAQLPEHENGHDDERANKKRKRAQSIKQEPKDGHAATYIKGEAGITKLGEREGAVDVMYTWAVRRDVFEVPTLIVMNVGGPFSIWFERTNEVMQFLPII
jgi:PAS domain-containing protein